MTGQRGHVMSKTKVSTWRVTATLTIGVDWTQEVRAAYRDTAIAKVEKTIKSYGLTMRHVSHAAPIVMT